MTGTTPTRTVERALALLATVCREDAPSLTECARSTELPPSTALRLLRTLERADFERISDIGMERGHQALGVMEKHLSGHAWFTGPDYGIADIALFAYTDVAPGAGFDLSPYPALRDWLARVRATPGFVAMPDPAPENAALLARSIHFDSPTPSSRTQ